MKAIYGILKVFIGYIIMLIILAFIASLVSCKTKTLHVPVEVIKTEYIDRVRIDSLLRYDSIFIDRFTKNDTVFLTKEKYRYIDRVKIETDSFIKIDSIQVPYPVKGDSVNYVTGFQNFQIWCGRILILLLFMYFGFKLLRKYIKI